MQKLFNPVCRAEHGRWYCFLMNTTTVPTMEFLLTKPNSSGNLGIYYKIKLANVFVSAMEPVLYPTVDGWYSNVDRIHLSYHTITFNDVASGKCYSWNQLTNAVCGCP
jgi:type VI protein secretion system component Hcp